MGPVSNCTRVLYHSEIVRDNLATLTPVFGDNITRNKCRKGFLGARFELHPHVKSLGKLCETIFPLEIKGCIHPRFSGTLYLDKSEGGFSQYVSPFLVPMYSTATKQRISAHLQKIVSCQKGRTQVHAFPTGNPSWGNLLQVSMV